MKSMTLRIEYDDNITDVSTLTNLVSLTLDFTVVNDVSMLINLTRLEIIDQFDPKPIDSLTNLTHLDLSSCDCEDDIPNLTNLQYLDVKYNKVVRNLSMLDCIINK